jgi:hypothetical protein
MSMKAISMAIPGYLLFCSLNTVMAMTADQKKQTAELTADAKRMWDILPSLASDARKTAGLIKDLEAFANLPAHPRLAPSEAARRNGLEAAAWLKQRLPKQYAEETGNPDIKAFAAPAPGARPLPIPKTIHFIWLGSPIPEKYGSNIRAIAALNADYKINIWLDDHSQASAEANPESRFTFRHVDQILNHAVASDDARNIYKLAVAKSGYRPNYAAASDLLRILILLAEGGVYLDTDTYVERVEAACGFGQLQAKYGFLLSTQTVARDGPVNNSPMAAVPGSPALRELLALEEKRYRDAAHAAQFHGQGPEGQSWLYWVATGTSEKMRLDSTCFLGGPGLAWDYLVRLGHGWLKAKNLKLEARFEPGPPAVELFTEETKKPSYYCSSAVAPVEDYFFLDTIFGDFDLTSETYGLSHKFDHAWLSPKASAAAAEQPEHKDASVPDPAVGH